MRSGKFRLPGKKALAKSDLQYRLVVMDATECPVEAEFYQQEVAVWLRLDERPTAVIAGVDTWPAAVGKQFELTGLRIPQDISITGVDDTPDAQFAFGGLTTIHQPFRDMGELAVERLVAMIEGAPVNECRIKVAAQIVVRGSTRALTP
jgi:DNA-binding LacI/PurR family transcriptional regulator